METLNIARDKEFEGQTLRTEIKNFLDILRFEIEELDKISTPDFWCKKIKEKKFPGLSQIALYSIPASSAFMERFFSIAGVINNKRRCNMNPETLIMRSIMKANMKYFDEIQLEI